jgi:hypothetical protein
LWRRKVLRSERLELRIFRNAESKSSERLSPCLGEASYELELFIICGWDLGGCWVVEEALAIRPRHAHLVDVWVEDVTMVTGCIEHCFVKITATE